MIIGEQSKSRKNIGFWLIVTKALTLQTKRDKERKQITVAYAEAVKAIKEAILESRYRAARLVNKEVQALYYAIGGYISVQSGAEKWGSNAIGTISELLQQELPGLRGFSETCIKRMRIFYEAWCGMFENRPSATDDLIEYQIFRMHLFFMPRWSNLLKVTNK